MKPEKKSNRLLFRLIPPAVFVVLGYVLWKHFPGIWVSLSANPEPLLLSIFFSLINGTGGLVAWYITVNARQRVLSFKEAYHLYAMTVLAKYLPMGKALQFFPLLAAKTADRKSPQLAYALLVSNLLGALVGIAIALVGTAMWVSEYEHYSKNLRWLGLALIAGLLVVRPLWAMAVRRFNLRGLELTHFTPKYFAQMGLLHLTLGWLAEGAALVFLVKGAGQEVTGVDFAHLITSYAIASLAGYLAVITPGGIGVREGLFAVLLQPRFTPGVAAYVAIAMRVASVLSDIIFSAGVLVFQVRDLRIAVMQKPSAKKS